MLMKINKGILLWIILVFYHIRYNYVNLCYIMNILKDASMGLLLYCLELFDIFYNSDLLRIFDRYD